MLTKLTSTSNLPDSLALELFHAARAFEVRLGQHLSDTLRKENEIELSPGQLGFLAALVCGTNTASAIARDVGISRQAVQRQVQEMVDRGYLAVSPDPERRNQSLIAFTPAGVDVMSACRIVLAGLDMQIGDRRDALAKALPVLNELLRGQ